MTALELVAGLWEQYIGQIALQDNLVMRCCDVQTCSAALAVMLDRFQPACEYPSEH